MASPEIERIEKDANLPFVFCIGFGLRHQLAAKAFTGVLDPKMGDVKPVPFKIALNAADNLTVIIQSVEADILPVLQGTIFMVIGNQPTNEGLSIGTVVSMFSK